MDREDIPDGVKRFILVSIHSIPQLEAILLLRSESEHAWDSKQLARRLYMSEKAASELLLALEGADVLSVADGRSSSFRYHPGSHELGLMIDLLADAYSRNLVAVTDLIHSKTKKA